MHSPVKCVIMKEYSIFIYLFIIRFCYTGTHILIYALHYVVFRVEVKSVNLTQNVLVIYGQWTILIILHIFIYLFIYFCLFV